MEQKQKAKGGKRNRKHGRSARNGQGIRYINERRREKNKCKRLRKHLLHFPNDAKARATLKSLGF